MLYKSGDRRPHVGHMSSSGGSRNFSKQVENMAPVLQYVNSICFLDKIIKFIPKLL